jgi:hypothetical protein
MIKNWTKFNEDFDDDEEVKPIGLSSPEGINGLECIFSPLEDDMVSDWNSDDTIKKWVQDERVFLQEIKYDEWAIYAKSGDKEVKKYIMDNFSW